MNRTQIREIFLRNGFNIKPGCDDLKSYVYEAAEELLSLAEAERLSTEQEEPVAYLRRDQLQQIKTRGPVVGCISPSPRVDMVAVYTAPQPAERNPSAGDSLTPVPDEMFAAEFAAWWEEHGRFCRAGGGTYERTFAFEAWRHLYPQLMNLEMAAAKQQPAPDVEKLPREAIAELIKGMAVSVDVSTGESDFGNRYFGVVDEVQWSANERHDMMLLVQEPEANFATSASPDVSALVEALEQVIKAAPSGGPLWHGSEQIVEAHAALAAHRKGGTDNE